MLFRWASGVWAKFVRRRDFGCPDCKRMLERLVPPVSSLPPAAPRASGSATTRGRREGDGFLLQWRSRCDRLEAELASSREKWAEGAKVAAKLACGLSDFQQERMRDAAIQVQRHGPTFQEMMDAQRARETQAMGQYDPRNSQMLQGMGGLQGLMGFGAGQTGGLVG